MGQKRGWASIATWQDCVRLRYKATRGILRANDGFPTKKSAGGHRLILGRQYNNILDPSFSNSNLIKSHSPYMLFFHFRSGLRLSSATAPLDCAVSVLLSALGVVGMVYAILKGYVMGLKAYGCRNKDANRWCCG
jgi:hypothetical protein